MKDNQLTSNNFSALNRWSAEQAAARITDDVVSYEQAYLPQRSSTSPASLVAQYLKMIDMQNSPTSNTQNIFRVILGIAMLLAGISHLTFQRQAFQAQVPDWVPLGKDAVVILSGIVEIALGIMVAFVTRYKWQAGLMLAVFYILVFPGNIAQYLNHLDAFGLNTDIKRLLRLFFQPVLVIWALWSTGATSKLRQQFSK